MSDEILDQELKQILWACLEYSKNNSLENMEFCFSWIISVYKEKYGCTFHQSKLYILVKLGYLLPVGTARGGKRRYYQIINPDYLCNFLKH